MERIDFFCVRCGGMVVDALWGHLRAHAVAEGIQQRTRLRSGRFVQSGDTSRKTKLRSRK
jgi:hypothetical protein